MNNKRTLIIAAIAVLVILTSVTGFPAFPRLGIGAQPNPVAGRSNSSDSLFNQIGQQNQAEANAGVNSRMLPGDEYIYNPLFQAAKTHAITIMKSPGDEYINRSVNQEVKTDGASLIKSPGDEYIPTH